DELVERLGDVATLVGKRLVVRGPEGARVPLLERPRVEALRPLGLGRRSVELDRHLEVAADLAVAVRGEQRWRCPIRYERPRLELRRTTLARPCLGSAEDRRPEAAAEE